MPFYITTFSALFLFSISVLSGQTGPAAADKPDYTDDAAEQIIRDYFTAIGGYRHYLSIRSLLTVAEASQPGQTVVITSARESPYYARVESALAEQPLQPTRIEGSNGTQVWFYQPDKDVPEVQTEPWRYTPAYDFHGPLVDHQRKGIVYASIGNATFRDRPARVLRAWYPDGSVERLFFSSDNNLLLGSVSESSPLAQTPPLTNVVARYQEYAGILFPTEVHIYSGEQLVQTLIIRDIQTNHEFNSILFDPPSLQDVTPP